MSSVNSVRVHFNSEAVSYVSYNKQSRSMTIKFTNGGRYRYTGVPLKVFAGVLNTKSVGRYVNKHVKGSFNSKKH